MRFARVPKSEALWGKNKGYDSAVLREGKIISSATEETDDFKCAFPVHYYLSLLIIFFTIIVIIS